MGTVITRILAGIGWVLVSWLLWAMSGNLLDFSVQYCDRHRIRIPFEIDLVLSFVVLSGILIIPPLTAVLAIRGKLPLTGPRNSNAGAPHGKVEPSPDAEWEKRYPRAAFRYCGKTILFYGHSHGNQIEYLDPDGHSYLWYPGNPVILVGRWRTDDSNIYFQYGTNTFNPVTGIIGGSWEVCPIDAWSVSIVEDVAGDICELKKGLPFVLQRAPKIPSIQGLKSGHHN